MDAAMESAARDRVRQMMATAPSQRPSDFVNPLEKIEQLLTCPICLDRYKQPKLLPCQHTFCHPCLESCADTLHRVLKCPECRAEHNIPFDGVKAFQPNYTLTGFLDIHLQATPESAAQIEEYIHRYNLERCKVCEEKADCETCAHCDRRACAECRKTHMDMLKRDMGRLMMQVKRLSNRITEASDGLSKALELLTLNCETTKQEVQEYFHRHIRELKKREEWFLGEIETFQGTESRLMSNLRDVLEIESSNMSEAVARLDAALKGECEMDDAEIVRYKNIFSEGLEYLRNFSPDADELFCKKLRFNVGDDASKLPQAIQTYGELTVLVPQFSGRYVQLEQSYLPRTIKVGLESEYFRIRSDENGRERERTSELSTRPSSRYGNRENEGLGLPEHSLRYRRRQQLEEEAWNRIRGVSGSNSGNETDRSVPGKSPWSRAPEAALTSEKTGNAGQTNLAVPSTATSTASSTSSSPVPKTPPPSPKANVPVAVPAPVTKTAAPAVVVTEAAKKKETQTSAKTAEAVKPPAETPKVESKPPTRKPPLPRQPSSQDEERGRTSRPQSLLIADCEKENENVDVQEDEDRPRTARFRLRLRASSVTRQDSNESGGDRETPIPIKHYPGEEQDGEPLLIRRRAFASQHSLANASEAVEGESPRADAPSWLARRRIRQQRSRTNPDLHAQFTSARVQQLLADRENRLLSDMGLESPTTGAHDEARARGGLRTRRSSIGARDPSAERGPYRGRGRPRAIFGRKGAGDGELNWPRGVAALAGGQLAVADSSNHRVCIFSVAGEFVRAFGGYGTAAGQLDSCAGVAAGRGRMLIVTDRYNHRVCVFDADGKLHAQWGGHGPANGKFNNPWGVAIDDLGTVYVVDKDNHRVQMFDKNGVFVGKFGAHGSADGQFNNPLFVAVNRINHTVYVTDSSNHRVNAYDLQGKYLFSFGQEGFQGGQFKFPRGITIDNQGHVIVVDSGNNRVQVFTSDGDFTASFGSWGAGAGQLKGAEDVCLLNDHLIVSDRENHRIQMF